MVEMVGVSWICSTLEQFRNRTFGSSLLNILAIRTSNFIASSVRKSAEPTKVNSTPHAYKTNKKTCLKSRFFYGWRWWESNPRPLRIKTDIYERSYLLSRLSMESNLT